MRSQHLIVPNSVDEDIYDALQAKGDLLRTIMGRPADYAKRLGQRLDRRD